MKAPACLALLLLLCSAPAARGWVGESPGSHHEQLALLAAERLPPEHRALLLEHREAFARGAWEPDANVHTFWHTYEPADGSGGAVYRLEEALHEATMALREGAPPEEVAYRMGYLTHFALDLSVPFHTADGLYDHRWHLEYERAAALQHDALRIEATRAPREAQDVRALAVALAEASAAEGPALVADLDAAGRPWTPYARDVTERMVNLGLDATADLLLTAFARADPARPPPEPTHHEHLPRVGEPEDVGLGAGDIRRLVPWEGALLAAAALAALAVAGVLAVHARRRVD